MGVGKGASGRIWRFEGGNRTRGHPLKPGRQRPIFPFRRIRPRRGREAALWQWGKDEHGAKVKKIICYCSKKFNLRESRWKTIEQETFGLIFALQKFRQFVQGCPVTLLTDHRNIKRAQL